jgi:hypothetical protein
MEREAARDMMNIQRESVRYRQEDMLRSMMISGRKTEVSGKEGCITITETERDMNRDIYGRSQADQAQQNCVDNLQTHLISFETEGREDTHSRGKQLSKGGGGERLSVSKITNERTQASNSTIFTEMILGQPGGLDNSNIILETESNEGRNEIIGGERRVKVVGKQTQA